MNKVKLNRNLIPTLLLILLALANCIKKQNDTLWPEITSETKPWTRWWWMGNILTREGITYSLEEYKKAGFGGLEITPIYGVKGFENQFIDYLSPEWMELLNHTLTEAKRLGLGIDMATGTGWPFGGPWIDSTYACKNFKCKIYTLNEGQTLSEVIRFIQTPYLRTVNRTQLTIDSLVYPVNANNNLQELALDQIQYKKDLPLIALMAYSDYGEKLDILSYIDENRKLNWLAPKGSWTIYAVFMGWHGKMVERAGPGGEGNVVDHFSKEALTHYLSRFSEAFKNSDIDYLRAFFNDSYEVDDAKGEADFTPTFFDEFLSRKGYDLRAHLNTLFTEDSSELKSRLLCDYREVISDLLLENFTITWKDWAKENNAIIRNQAHGSPANILDLYAACDIPETEGKNVLTMKYASSAANITGKRLVSSETATWLNEHFTTSLADVKTAIDNCFLSGVNHIIYHGTPYSPPFESWPGWLFYASVHFGPTNTIWKDLPQLNDYVACCESFLQSGNSANDILVYYPMYDKWSETGTSFLHHVKLKSDETTAGIIAEKLYQYDYAFDYISDRQINLLTFSDEKLNTGFSNYKVLIVPATKYMPYKTFSHLIELARQGATILFQMDLPASVPGFGEDIDNSEKFETLKQKLNFVQVNINKECNIGKGKIVIFIDVFEGLKNIDIMPAIYQALTTNLKAVKRINENGTCLFIVNKSDSLFDRSIIVPGGTENWVRFNPVNHTYGKIKCSEISKDISIIYLQLESGESCILQQYADAKEIEDYQVIDNKRNPIKIKGDWHIQFISGGPQIPSNISTHELKSWTEYEESMYFSGTGKYSVTFNKPEASSTKWILDLGEVHESAKVFLNNHELGSLICPPYQILIKDEILKQQNILEIEVTNLMANHIIYLDKNNINYKKFYNINFPGRLAENRDENNLFNASHWEPLCSGLIGPVTLIPVTLKTE
ncbi:MAG: glycoside hydrolase family 2 protein [Bacteroidales bacterium]|nr:glycoside hydrolase family 2 protein [Bacteroidales bacterium]